MANVSRVNGFRPSKTLNGACWNSAINKYYVPSSNAVAMGVGDFVKLAGGSDANGVPAIAKAAVGDAVIGSIAAVNYDMTDLNTPQDVVAGVATYVYVTDDPETIYEAEVSGTVATTLVGLNANHADAGVSAFGQSGETVNAATAATTATLTFKILGFVQAVDNEVGTYAKVFGKINNHQLASGTGTLGV